MTNRRRILSCVLGLFVGFSVSVRGVAVVRDASSPVTERDSGRIVQKDDSAVVVRTARETLNFDDQESLRRMPKSAQVGDQVVIRFTRESDGPHLQGATVQRKQQAGERGGEILDDRAFYSASRGAGQSANPSK